MKIIRKEALDDGSRPPIQSWDAALPEGYAWVPAELDDGRFEAANGFVTITADDENVVTAMAEEPDAKAAWLAAQSEPEAAVSAMETALELLADHEYRLCLLELGAAE